MWIEYYWCIPHLPKIFIVRPPFLFMYVSSKRWLSSFDGASGSAASVTPLCFWKLAISSNTPRLARTLTQFKNKKSISELNPTRFYVQKYAFWKWILPLEIYAYTHDKRCVEWHWYLLSNNVNFLVPVACQYGQLNTIFFHVSNFCVWFLE